MQEKSKRIISIVATFVLAIVFLVTSLCDYGPTFAKAYQLTFLSNLMVGVFMLAVGICMLCNKKLPQFLFLDCTVLLLLVFVVSLVMGYEFTGFKLFLHGINPGLMLIYYLIFTNQTNSKWYLVFTTLVIPGLFMCFAFIFGSVTGNYIYAFLDFNAFGTGKSLLFIFGALVGLIGMGFGFLYLNKAISKRKNN